MTNILGAVETWRWRDIRLVVFDVDGTLYRQDRLRLRMAIELILDGVKGRGRATVDVLARYRRIREAIGEQGVPDFNTVLLERTAVECGCSAATVDAIVKEWIDNRPLRFLPRLRYAGLDILFDSLRRHRKVVGIFSDYPAAAKLEALGLKADIVISSTDARVGVLKPNPEGLIQIMMAAGASPAQTLMIGDRVDRDGVAARTAGANVIIRSSRPLDGWHTFRDYHAQLFSEVVQ